MLLIAVALNTDIYTRTLITTLESPAYGKIKAQISELTGVKPRTVDCVYSRAIQAGFEPNVLPLKILKQHVQDAPRSGRHIQQTAEAIQQIVDHVRRDRYRREKTCTDLASDLSRLLGIKLSRSTIYRVLKTTGFRKTKLARKSGLTQKMKDERLRWALDHKD